MIANNSSVKKRTASRKNSYKVGHREILWIANEIGKEAHKKNEETQWILKAARQIGVLAWRPDLEQGQLVRADEQSWAQELTLGARGKSTAQLARREVRWP